MPERALVIGAGVGGLTAALALSRAGHPVTLLERDELRPLADADEAFATERRGAPQVHQTHGFLARLQVTLRDRFPDVLDDLLAAGGTTMPMTAALGEPRPGDEDLKVIIVRRSTLEWVLRKAVEAQPGVELRTGAGVAGLLTCGANDRDVATGEAGSVGRLTAADDAEARTSGASVRNAPASETDGGLPTAGAGGVPVVSGVRLEDGEVIEADVVVAAAGRRGPVPQWLREIGVDVPETVHESGLMYLTRWYHRVAGDAELDPKLGGDLGFVKYLAVPGDGDTLSVTLAVRTADSALRSALSDADRFDHACRVLPGPDQFFAGDAAPLEPIGGVRPMTGLVNRLRRFVDGAGHPTVLGFHALGDCHTTTNPLYGRGCSLAAVQAVLLADALTAHPGDPVARAAAYEAGNAAEIEPWFESAVQMDRLGADPAGSGSFGGAARSTDGDGQLSDAARAMGAVFVAAQTDPVIGRGIARFMNLLATPAQLMADGELMTRIMEVMADPSAYPIPPREGPSRRELLELLGGELVA